MKHVKKYYGLLDIDFKEFYSGINLLNLTIKLTFFLLDQHWWK